MRHRRRLVKEGKQCDKGGRSDAHSFLLLAGGVDNDDNSIGHDAPVQGRCRWRRSRKPPARPRRRPGRPEASRSRGTEAPGALLGALLDQARTLSSSGSVMKFTWPPAPLACGRIVPGDMLETRLGPLQGRSAVPCTRFIRLAEPGTAHFFPVRSRRGDKQFGLHQHALDALRARFRPLERRGIRWSSPRPGRRRRRKRRRGCGRAVGKAEFGLPTDRSSCAPRFRAGTGPGRAAVVAEHAGKGAPTGADADAASCSRPSEPIMVAGYCEDPGGRRPRASGNSKRRRAAAARTASFWLQPHSSAQCRRA